MRSESFFEAAANSNVAKAKLYIDQYYLKNPPLAEIAEKAGISKFHFIRCFKKAYGITPYQYLLIKRLLHASRLKNKNKSFSKIAIECGFSDVFTFSKAYKRTFGINPSKNLTDS